MLGAEVRNILASQCGLLLERERQTRNVGFELQRQEVRYIANQRAKLADRLIRQLIRIHLECAPQRVGLEHLEECTTLLKSESESSQIDRSFGRLECEPQCVLDRLLEDRCQETTLLLVRHGLELLLPRESHLLSPIIARIIRAHRRL